MKQDIQSLTLDELTQVMLSLGEKKFRAEQIFHDIMLGKKIEEITTISQDLKNKLKEIFEDEQLKILTEKQSADGTSKFLYSLADGNIVEGVLMRYKFGNTLCVSSQVGCRMGCKFCASGLDGLVRNLTAGEILSQVIAVNRLLGGTLQDRKISNIVLMGSGEPLDNFDNLIQFLKIVTCNRGLNFSERSISISTCGLVPKIYKLADSGFKINICLSLHASNDQTRRQLMPVAKGYTVAELLDACDYYFDKTGRRILFEYILIKDVNSSTEHALRLAKMLCKRNCIVNLINLNEVKENDFKRCSEETVNRFAEILKSYNINVTTRRSLGNDVDGACGQLRRSYIKNSSNKGE
ncbi:MAG: 23S rRNA (adenine(2503)-C(2))-methyltransferase RlmN [Christensenellales bacterium]